MDTWIKYTRSKIRNRPTSLAYALLTLSVMCVLGLRSASTFAADVLLVDSGANNVQFEALLRDGLEYALKDRDANNDSKKDSAKTLKLHNYTLYPDRNWKLASDENQAKRFQSKLNSISDLKLIVTLDTPSQLYLQQYGIQHYEIKQSGKQQQGITKNSDLAQKDLPVLFANTFSQPPARQAKEKQKHSYITTDVDLIGNLKLIKTLLPNAKHIAVISSHFPWQYYFEDQLEQDAQALDLKLTHLNLAEKKFSEFARDLKSQIDTDAVFLLDAQQDSQGNIISFEESTRFIRRQTDAAIFYPFQTTYNENLVGGKQISAYQLGLTTGYEINRLLTNRAAKPIEKHQRFSASHVILNQEQISAQNIDEDLLPEHAEISHTGADSSPQKGVLILISALLVLQSFLIAGLQLSRLRTKKAKDSLTEIQHTLEVSVKDRTEKLKDMNSQLYEEIAKHEVTEELLRETQEYLNSIINSMPSILIGVTSHGYVTHWNSSAEAATAKTPKETMGQLIDEVFPAIEVSAQDIHTAISQNSALVKENIKKGEGADTTYMDVAVYPLVASETSGAVIRVDDVTMRVRLENMMIQNEKMMSLGELAAGTAHEINNPLAAILQGVQNLQRRIDVDLPANQKEAEACGTDIQTINNYLANRSILEFVNGIRNSGERAARIVRNMLEFSHSKQQEHSEINLNELLEHSLELAKSTFELKSNYDFKHIQLETKFDTNLPLVPCSPAEIEQVILNLVRNASHATEDCDSPKIEMITEQQDNNACIIINDNGVGMPENVRKHIFEPFFTTKSVGEGTGLGLSVSYFIITEHHGGTIEVESTLNEGTRFIIRLPLT